VLDALPRNASTKISKPALRDPAVVAAATALEHLRRTPEEHLRRTPEKHLGRTPGKER
jgi:hypothetical protein